ncbi:head-tail connector protein [Haliea salexigens]|uniref:head-tail connector protein n=1 Tax=Haliea salexigens TaxID=287487 RepID=UPI0004868FF5|nr:hypothetical protein [Haliea salexigens]
MKLIRRVAPTVLPVTVSECKRDLRIFDQSSDPHIAEIIKEVVDYLDGPDGAIGRALVTQEWALSMRDFYTVIDVPLTPVQSIESISYFDTENATQSFDVASYFLHSDNDQAHIELVPGASMPGVYDRPDAVSIVFKAGYGDTAQDVPASIRRAMRILVAHWFDNPVVYSSSSVNAMPMSAEALIAIHRKGWVSA